MTDEPGRQTSRIGVILVLLAVGGSAVGVVGWHLHSNRNAGLDTTGFDMGTTPDPVNSAAPPSFPASVPSSRAPAPRTSLGMVKGDASIRIIGPGASTPQASGPSGATTNPANPKEEAVLTFKKAALKNEKSVAAFVRRMEAKHPSITKYGKDWAASPELRALRDQYWRERDPLKFVYGIAKSNDFGKLVRKYATDPGIRDAIVKGVRELPSGLVAAAGGVYQNDKVARYLVMTVIKAMGLPGSLTGLLDGSNAKPPDQNQIISDIMKSGDMKKAAQNQQSPVPLDDQKVDKSTGETTNNGFTPLGGRR
ncbi:MAG: hypothetical protein AAB268_01945 [Elusimicrobiota bacterium]